MNNKISSSFVTDAEGQPDSSSAKKEIKHIKRFRKRYSGVSERTQTFSTKPVLPRFHAQKTSVKTKIADAAKIIKNALSCDEKLLLFF